jgi:hypothetical protein
VKRNANELLHILMDENYGMWRDKNEWSRLCPWSNIKIYLSRFLVSIIATMYMWQEDILNIENIRDIGVIGKAIPCRGY